MQAGCDGLSCLPGASAGEQFQWSDTVKGQVSSSFFLGYTLTNFVGASHLPSPPRVSPTCPEYRWQPLPPSSSDATWSLCKSGYSTPPYSE